MAAVSELSRRERIMREVRRRMDEIEEGLPTADPFKITFGTITRGGPLEGIHQGDRYSMTIVDTDESKAAKINQVVVSLTVVLEFEAWVDEGEEPSQVGNRVLTDVQRKMREDLNLTEPDDGRPVTDRQLSENVQEVRNQLFIDGFADRRISGAVFYDVTYKHAISDPRALVSSL